ncbi:hypothetical protein P153DRAFT_348110 [Dothidotthia symphoricarpi CBS 119687]|uniref:Putative gamma-glutamylcyclotransferase n=1 Tax=Dothidotthia symphoricarpi CBS 119687 TaxID=1392245 RepID=A0A6A6A429_9PLEO|nr:uncharacterized protein P153DRAFT_348110 [Dothidotthia symphoricarpi CBS 119687]KAF2125903.1 hypothetical protein P153DRAFT_348110 [Dothidotthia symphoricarpi CBS 119687]
MPHSSSNHDHNSALGHGASWNHVHTASTPNPAVPQSTIPPPPPLPPASRPKNPKISCTIPPPLGLPSSFGYEPVGKDMAKRIMMFLAEEKTEHRAPPLVPCHMFFYGSLMDPDVLQAITGLPEAPLVKKGTITGFSIRMWGTYPALVPCSTGEVKGTVWELTSEAHFRRLADYETLAYTWCECNVVLEDGKSLSSCRTFCWAGDVNSQDLEEREFDFERYQKHFKPSVLRRGTPS